MLHYYIVTLLLHADTLFCFYISPVLGRLQAEVEPRGVRGGGDAARALRPHLATGHCAV